MKPIRKFIITSLISLSLVAVAPCAFGEVVFNRGNTAEPGSLDPSRLSTTYASAIADDMFIGLMTYDAHGGIIPGLATSYSESSDGKSYTFKLRDMLWSDGTPITSKDVKFGFLRTLDPNTASVYATVLYPIVGAKAFNTGKGKREDVGIDIIDDKTIQFHLSNPTPYFPALTTHNSTFAQPEHVIKKFGDAWMKPKNIVTSGAYTLAQWQPNSFIKLVRNPKFYDNKNVQIDTIYYYPTEDKGSSWLRFKEHEIDFDDQPGVTLLNTIRKEDPKALRISPRTCVYYYTFNGQRKPFNDFRVTRALSMTIDRQDITKSVMQDGSIPAYSFVMPGLPNYGTPPHVIWKDWSWEKRVKTAKALLKQAGFDSNNPLKFVISYNTLNQNKLVAVDIANIWKTELGVDATLFNTEAKTHYANLTKRDFDVARASWCLDYPDAQNILFLAESASKSFNYADYNNPEYNKLMVQSGKELDLKKRANLMKKAEAILLHDQPVAPVYFYVQRNLVASYLKGYFDNPENEHLSRWLSIKGKK